MMYTIENKEIAVTCVQGKDDTGFNIAKIENKKTKKQWLFYQPQQNGNTSQCSYDEQYFGGMEFVFPNDEEETFSSQFWLDHGLLWRIPYQVFTEKDKITARYSKKEALSVEYKAALIGNIVQIELVISNLTKERYPFLIRLHPSFLLESCDTLELYGEEFCFEGLEQKYCSFSAGHFDTAKRRIITETGRKIDIELPDTWGKEELFLHAKQKKGMFAIQKEKGRLLCRYANEQFPYLTIYSFYDKTKGRIAIIEPANRCGANLHRIEAESKLQYMEAFSQMRFSVTFEIH